MQSHENLNSTYDANGNTLSDAQCRSFTWDFENRLTQATVPQTGGGSNTVTFSYDPFGRRIQKASPLGTTDYLYDDSNTVEEVGNSGSVQAKYTQGAGVDEPLAEYRSGTTNYYQQDGLGTVSSLTNSAAAIASSYVFDSFGKLTTTSSGALANSLQYAAWEFDSETGIYFNRARYYDPNVGRFTSEDPIRAGLNFYAYVTNNVVTSPFHSSTGNERNRLFTSSISYNLAGS